jgi:surface antigen
MSPISIMENWKMPMLAQFIESLTQEHKKLIQMGLMKDPKAHALTMHDGKGSSKHNMKEGYSKPFNDSSSSKDSSDSKNKKKGKQCTYCNKPNHEESTHA